MWLFAVYGSIVLQELFLDDADVRAIVWTIPMGVLLAAAMILWQQGFVLHPRDLRIGLYGFFTAGILLGVLSPTATKACRDDKCSAFGSLYQGGFPHENTMGYAASLTFIALATAGSQSRRHYSCLLYTSPSPRD